MATDDRPELADRPRVGYLGPEGTFSEEVLLASAAPDAVEPVGLASIYDTVMALRHGELSWAVVPIENSLEGSINVTLDLLAAEASDVEIVGEALLRVRHSLIAAEPIGLAEIETVITHPQVPGQCERFLRGELAHARIVPASSTAEAVRSVVAGPGRGQAALGTTLAAKIYGGTVVREGVEDRDDNETRFVWLARAGQANEPPLRARATAEWKTSLVFWGPGVDSPGWLVRCLDEFGRRSINLTKIESRPRRARLGAYMFFADLAGRVGEEAVDEAIAGVTALCEELRVLGSYRAARPPAAPAS
ncbi:MAG TPA: prephenate dehydratase [Solirubrobacteraceae bacterium]|nr:prephenate dehydratase [Solirubrobacteraceae bacterium]